MTFTILAIDPGPEPGVVTLYPALVLGRVQTFNLSPEDLVAWLARYRHNFNAIVCERFDVGPRTAKSTKAGAAATLSLIGQLQQVAPDLVMQSAGTVKPWATDRRLRTYGVYVTGDHHRDAVRHALYYTVKHGYLPKRGTHTPEEAKAQSELGAAAPLRGPHAGA